MTEIRIPTPLPRIPQFQSMGLGLFLHWGLYSLIDSGEWVFKIEKWNRQQYRKLAQRFTAADFDPYTMARHAQSFGVRYMVLTTRHHDGFSLYDTRGLSDFDAMQSAANRDLVKEFADGCKKAGIVPFFYHTTLDWMWNGKITDELNESEFDEYLEYLRESVEILCRNYGQIGGLWFDGNWSRPESDWRESKLYSTIRKYQPDAIIANNTGLSARGKTGHPEIDCLTYEQGLPTRPDQTGWPKYLAGEMCETLNRHWGYAKNDFHYKSLADMIQNFCQCRKVGMNYLFNIGPEASGRLPALEEVMLQRFGEWVGQYGETLIKSRPSSVQCDHTSVFIMEDRNTIYGAVSGLGIKGDGAVTVEEGKNITITLSSLPIPLKQARWIDNDEPLYLEMCDPHTCRIHLTPHPYGHDYVVRIFCAN